MSRARAQARARGPRNARVSRRRAASLRTARRR
jgi:hypothetical protein